jgi:hypothetical protein
MHLKSSSDLESFYVLLTLLNYHEPLSASNTLCDIELIVCDIYGNIIHVYSPLSIGDTLTCANVLYLQ